MNLKTSSQARNDSSELGSTDIEELRSSIKGTVLTKAGADEKDHNDALERWNRVYIKQAALVVLVEGEEDIATCIKLVKKHNLDVAVAGGRHSYHGASSSTGMVIDLRKMRNVSVNKAAMTVTAQGGCIAHDVEQPCEAEGLSVVFGAVSETGIGGLTLGGGVGWLTGTHGLALDNLLSARVALANGDIVNASETENPDLFWAIRGGGANFGICTEFKFRVHEQGPVFLQIHVFTPDKLKSCVSLLNKMHDVSLQASNGKLQIMLLWMTPPGAPGLCPAYAVFYNGPEDEAKELVEPILKLEPMHTMGGPCNYTRTTQIPPGMEIPGYERYAASSAHMDYPLDESLILSVFERFQQVVLKYGEVAKPSKCVLDIRNYEKVASVPTTSTAYAGRYNSAWMIPDLQWSDTALDAKMREEVTAITAFVREKLQERKITAEVRDDGQRDVTAIYPNISAGGEEKAKSVFGPNLNRLQVLKQKFDPEGMWNKWFPITPAEAV